MKCKLCRLRRVAGSSLVFFERLSVGDAFEERFFYELDRVAERIATHQLSTTPWPYTDDTQMALSAAL
jgi:hypothetical protein